MKGTLGTCNRDQGELQTTALGQIDEGTVTQNFKSLNVTIDTDWGLNISSSLSSWPVLVIAWAMTMKAEITLFTTVLVKF